MAGGEIGRGPGPPKRTPAAAPASTPCSDAQLLYEIGLYIGHSSRLGVCPAPHLAFRIFTPFKGFLFLLRHPALRLFAPSTGFLLLFCAQLAHLFLGVVVLGRVGAHRRPPSHALATPTVSWQLLTTRAQRPNEGPRHKVGTIFARYPSVR